MHKASVALSTCKTDHDHAVTMLNDLFKGLMELGEAWHDVHVRLLPGLLSETVVLKLTVNVRSVDPSMSLPLYHQLTTCATEICKLILQSAAVPADHLGVWRGAHLSNTHQRTVGTVLHSPFISTSSVRQMTTSVVRAMFEARDTPGDGHESSSCIPYGMTVDGQWRGLRSGESRPTCWEDLQRQGYAQGNVDYNLLATRAGGGAGKTKRMMCLVWDHLLRALPAYGLPEVGSSSRVQLPPDYALPPMPKEIESLFWPLDGISAGMPLPAMLISLQNNPFSEATSKIMQHLFGPQTAEVEIGSSNFYSLLLKYAQEATAQPEGVHAPTFLEVERTVLWRDEVLAARQPLFQTLLEFDALVLPEGVGNSDRVRPRFFKAALSVVLKLSLKLDPSWRLGLRDLEVQQGHVQGLELPTTPINFERMSPLEAAATALRAIVAAAHPLVRLSDGTIVKSPPVKYMQVMTGLAAYMASNAATQKSTGIVTVPLLRQLMGWAATYRLRQQLYHDEGLDFALDPYVCEVSPETGMPFDVKLDPDHKFKNMFQEAQTEKVLLEPSVSALKELAARHLICKNVSLSVIEKTFPRFEKHRAAISGRLDKQRVDPPKAAMTDMAFHSMTAESFPMQAIFQAILGRAWLAESKLPFSDAWRQTAFAQCAAMINFLFMPYVFTRSTFPQHIMGVTSTGLLDILYNCSLNRRLALSLQLQDKMPALPNSMSLGSVAGPLAAPWSASGVVEVFPDTLLDDGPMASGSVLLEGVPVGDPIVVPRFDDLNLEATGSNGCETVFSQVQAMSGGYKPLAKEVMRILGKVEYSTCTRMQPDTVRGFYVPLDCKATYGTTLLGFVSSGAADDAGSEARVREDARTAANTQRIMGNFNNQPIRELYRHRNPNLAGSAMQE